MREILGKQGYVNAEDMNGYRAPYVQIGGNTEFKTMEDALVMYRRVGFNTD